MEKSWVELNAGRIAYVEEGEGEPILLLHGIPTSSFLWRSVIPILAERFSVYAPDLLGYGDSDKPERVDLSVSAQADYIHAFMQKVGWKEGYVVGHDIGGGIAQLVAIRHPEAVKKLVLMDTIAYDSWPVPEIERLKEPAWDQIMETLDLFKGFKKAFQRGIFHKERVTDELVSAYVKPFEGLVGRMAYLRCARALKTEDLLAHMDEVEQLPIPVLIIWGEGDDFQLVHYGRRLGEGLKQAKLVVVKGAGHFIQEDRPEEVARLIGEFIQSGRVEDRSPANTPATGG